MTRNDRNASIEAPGSPTLPDRQRGAIDRLASIASAFDDGRPVSPEDANWLAAGVVRQLAGEPGMTLEQAIGAAAGPGQRTARTLLTLNRRNRAILQLARDCLPGLTRCEQAGQIAAMARRYGGSVMAHGGPIGRPSAIYAGAPRELLAAAFSTGRTPLSAGHIRRILTAGLRTSSPVSCSTTCEIVPST